MPYTCWLAGVLIGETDFEHEGQARQRVGEFRPTPYGLDVFPRLNVLATARAFARECGRRDLTDHARDPDDIDAVLETAAGQRMVDLGRALSELEIRDPTGVHVDVATIAFVDLLELEGGARNRAVNPRDRSARRTPRGPRYLVSATFGTPPDAGVQPQKSPVPTVGLSLN